MAKNLTEADVFRRLDFILQEARLGVTDRGLTITSAMREASDFYSTGKALGSAAAKLNCTRMSRAALLLFNQLPRKEWLAGTINEHPQPLRLIWTDIVARKNEITRAELVATFKLHTMVTVTKEEDDRLRPLTEHPALERYRLAKIEVLERPEGGWKTLPA